MPPFGNNGVEQPLVVFFNLTMGSLTNIYQSGGATQPLDIPVDFNLRHTLGQGDLNMTLFDVTGQMVEPFFFQNQGNMSFQFGYQGKTPLMSPVYKIASLKYKPIWKENSFGFSVHADHVIMAAMASSTIQNTGNFDQLLQNYRDAYPDLTITVTPPPMPMVDVGPYSKDSTEPIERQWTKWLSETDWSFLVGLVKNLRSQDGKSGYQITYNPSQNSLLIFLPGTQIPGAAQDLKYSYPSREGNVISFEPDIDFSAYIQGGGGQTLNHSLGGDQQTTNLSPESMKPMNPTHMTTVYPPALANAPQTAQQGIPPYTGTPGTSVSSDQAQINWMDPSSKPQDLDGSGRIRSAATGSSGSKYAGANPLIWKYMVSQLAMVTVSMTVLGDPMRVPGEIVHVDVFYPKNYDPNSKPDPHYLTGDYYVNEVVHSISAGKFTSTLNMSFKGPFNPPTSGK